MSVDPRFSLKIVRKELEECIEDSKRYGWDISDIDEQNQIFHVKMASPIDKELFIIEFKFDNYRQWPLYIEFIAPTGEKGTKNAYPAPSAKNGGFFHPKPCICHPCSRKAYKGYTGLHQDWGTLEGWLSNPKVTTLTNIRAILQAIYFRISDTEAYRGRMSG